jgi:hypothetical protein
VEQQVDQPCGGPMGDEVDHGVEGARGGHRHMQVAGRYSHRDPGDRSFGSPLGHGAGSLDGREGRVVRVAPALDQERDARGSPGAGQPFQLTDELGS